MICDSLGPGDGLGVRVELHAHTVRGDLWRATLYEGTFGQRERHTFGVMFLHFVSGGFTADEQHSLNFEVAQHRLRRTPSAPFPPPRGQVR
jgi:hypothetical protein